MLLEPTSVEDLQSKLAASAAVQRSITRIDLRALDRIIEYTPEDMVVTVQTGIALTALQKELSSHGQWLPIDPPEPSVTIAEIIARNLSGSRRLGFGTIRDHLLGLSALLADGTRITGGGKVVKNVAGFDLPKLFVGAQDTLGIAVEASFKLLPLPEIERFARATFGTLAEAEFVCSRFSEARLWPAILDLYRSETNGRLILLAAFAGAKEEVEAQIEKVHRLGLREPGSSEEQSVIWSQMSFPHKHSVLPSKLFATIAQLKPEIFLARVGNGILYSSIETSSQTSIEVLNLMKRLKTAFDPAGILPEFSL